MTLSVTIDSPDTLDNFLLALVFETWTPSLVLIIHPPLKFLINFVVFNFEKFSYAEVKDLLNLDYSGAVNLYSRPVKQHL